MKKVRIALLLVGLTLLFMSQTASAPSTKTAVTFTCATKESCDRAVLTGFAGETPEPRVDDREALKLVAEELFLLFGLSYLGGSMASSLLSPRGKHRR